MIPYLLFAAGLLTLALGLLAIWHAGDKLREAHQTETRAREEKEHAQAARKAAEAAWARFSRVGPSPVTEVFHLYRQ